MNIIYHCFGGAHSSITAAALHLGYLPQDIKPSSRDLHAVPGFDQATGADHGRLYWMGEDDLGHQVYTTGWRQIGPSTERVLRQVMQIYGLPSDDTLFVDALPAVNLWMMIGGWTSRRAGIQSVGRPIVTSGTRVAFRTLNHIVKTTLAGLKPKEAIHFKYQGKSCIFIIGQGGPWHIYARARGLVAYPEPINLRPWLQMPSVLYLGKDAENHPVYAIWAPLGVEVMMRSIADILRLYDIHRPMVRFVMAKPVFPWNLFNHLPNALTLRLAKAGKLRGGNE